MMNPKRAQQHFWRHRDSALTDYPSRLSFFARENIYGAGKTGCERQTPNEPNAIDRGFFKGRR